MSLEGFMIMEDDALTPVPEELLLTDDDFPLNYVNKQHPEDYVVSSIPIAKELIFHERKLRHPRLLLRISIELATNKFCPMTFVLDTGAPKIYTSVLAKAILQSHDIQIADEDLGINYVQLLGKKYRVEDTPEGHAPANIIGLKTLCRWGLSLYDTPSFGFEFAEEFDYLTKFE